MGFVRNQLEGFMFEREGENTYLIHDNSGELRWFDYTSLGIKSVRTVPYSPDMNAFAERFVRTARNECFDHFILFHKKQVGNLMREFARYYNTQRPHQGIGNGVPIPGYRGKGKIRTEPVLYGLHTNFYREAS